MNTLYTTVVHVSYWHAIYMDWYQQKGSEA